MFNDREDAARQLATRLAAYRGLHPLILAIPRGAVPMGKVLAELLQGDMDVVLVRKLRAPYQPEVAIGSVDESGWSYIAPYAASVGAPLRQTSCRLPFHADDPRQSDTTCKRINIRQSS